MSFAGSTFGPYLDLRCDEHGVTRLPAVKAVGQVMFSGAAGTVIPAGTTVATPSDPATNNPSVKFVTNTDAILDGSGVCYVEVEAIEAGKAGNVGAQSISVMVTPVTGIAGVTNPNETSGGSDQESDEDS
ncbi:hypothetical protein N752_29230 [Desulforamulus aquiferis]|nr:hypothetical protein N752_29230 [Desulforamulus aquiferis]